MAYLASPLLAILSGALLAIYFDREFFPQSKKIGEYLLKTAIVLIGFNLNAVDMWLLSKDYFPVIFILITSVLVLGVLLGKVFKVDKVMSQLITSGTAICGGTTIVTLAPIIKARADQVALALAMVFSLNMIAIIMFPIIGNYFEMSDLQFGVWSALSVHDTSSVVATASTYSDEASRIAATVKLGRTLWLIPMVIFFSMKHKEANAKMKFPLFILFFILASIGGTVLDGIIPTTLYEINNTLSKTLLVLALFFVGTECNRGTLKLIRPPYIIQALILWVTVVFFTLVFSLSL